MESFGSFGFSDMNQTVRKKRSDRRPRNDTQLDYQGNSSLSSSPPSENGGKGLSDDNVGHGTNYRQKELSLNKCDSRASYTNLTDAENTLKTSREFDPQESSDGKDTFVGSSEDAFTSTSKQTKNDARRSDSHNSGRLEIASDAKGNENVVKRVKLKVGGIVRTIQAKPSCDSVTAVSESSMVKPPLCPSSNRSSQKLFVQGNSDEDHSFHEEKGRGLRGIPWKDFSRTGFDVSKVASSRHNILEESKSDKYEPLRKSKRVPKRRLLDDGEDDDVDDEIRYLEKLKSRKFDDDDDDDDEGGIKKRRKISSVFKMESYGSSRLGIDKRKSKAGGESEDTDYNMEAERISDVELQFEFKKQKEGCDVLGRKELAVTTRRQALQSGKDISTNSNAALVEFPDGLPPAPPRKQKDKLSEVEQQLKKAEATQRRKLQAQKAARESEAEAIRKILGQDSSRKKRENKMKQRQEELAQERNSKAATIASSTVRWVIGPSGTVVTFSDDMGLPSIFESRPCSYPPPREKCAGPSCTNPFRYRDSRSKLPLCSLRCYKALQEKTRPLTAC